MESDDNQTGLRNTSLFWLLQSGGWLAFGLLMTVWGLSYWSLPDTLVHKTFLVGTGFGLTLGFRQLFRRSAGPKPIAQASLVGLLCLGGALLWTEVYYVFIELWGETKRAGAPLVRLQPLPIGTLVLYFFVLLAWCLLYLGIGAQLALGRATLRAARAEALAHEARLTALRAQLEPHFLFNTLNAVSTLVAEGERSQALEMIASLSDFLRQALETREAAEVSVSEELDFVRRYLAIQKFRFGDLLRFSIEASPEALRGKVPTLVLQPLVENALKHGALAREGGGSVSISASNSNGHLEIVIVDDGPGLANGGQQKGLGLTNTEARLRELYGEGATLSLEDGPAGGVQARLRLPLSEAP